MKKWIVSLLLGLSVLSVALAGINRWDSKPIATGSIGVITLSPEGGEGPTSTLYATVQGVLYKSTDTAQTWTNLEPISRGYAIRELVVDPADPNVLYAAVGDGVHKSVDAGMNWSPTGLAGVAARDIAIDPGNSSRLYVATDSSYYRSLNGGESWTEIVEGIDADPLFPYSITVDPSTPSTLYATARFGNLFKSTNSGQNWVRLGADLDLPFYTPTVEVNPQDSSIVYVVFAADSSIMPGKSLDGIYRSEDGGESWNLILTTPFIGYSPLFRTPFVIDPTDPTILYTGLGYGVLKSSDNGESWFPLETGLNGEQVRSLVLDPQQPAILYAGTRDTVFRSQDGAANWERSGDGIASALVYDLAFSTSTLIAGTPTGLYLSSDSGDSWSPPDPDLPFGYRIAVDPVAPNILYASDSDYLYKSSDGGQSWQRRVDPLPGFEIAYSLTVDSNRRLFIGGYQYVLRSNNGGSTFTVLGGLPKFLGISAIEVDPQTPSRLFAATATGPAGFFRSDDSGATWVNKSSGLDQQALNALAVNRENPSILYAATRQGLYKSSDSGESWMQIFQPGVGTYISDVQLDPLRPDVVYAAGYGVHRSPDGGMNWQLVGSGLDDEFVESLVFDPLRPSRIFAGTGVKGVFVISQFLLDSVEPATAAPGDRIIIRGSGFLSGPVEVLIGGVAVPVLEILDDGTLIVEIPPIGPGPADVTLRLVPEEGEEVPATREGDELTVDYAQRLLVPQYGTGGGLVSDLVIGNPSPYQEALIRLSFFDPDGQPSPGVSTDQGLELVIPPLGSRTLQVGVPGVHFPVSNEPGGLAYGQSSAGGRGGPSYPLGMAPVITGSAEVLSTRPVSVVIRFGLEGTGLAGVQPAPPLSAVQLPVRQVRNLDTGIAVRNAEDRPNHLILELKDDLGEVLAEEEVDLGAGARFSEFFTQLFPGLVEPGFRGSVCIRSEDGLFSAIALELEPGVAMTTLPAAPIETTFSLPSSEKRSVPAFIDILRVDFSASGEYVDLTLWFRGALPEEGDSRVDGLLYRVLVDLEAPYGGGEDFDQIFTVSGNSMNRYSGQGGVADFEIGERSIRFQIPVTAFGGSSQFEMSADALYLSDTVSSDLISPIRVVLPYQPPGD